MTCDISCFISTIKSLWMTSWSNKTWMTLKLFLFQYLNFFHDEMDENFFISKLVSLATWQLYIKVCFFMHFSPPGGLYFLEFSLYCCLCEASIKIMSFWAFRQWFSNWNFFFMILISLRWNLPTIRRAAINARIFT